MKIITTVNDMQTLSSNLRQKKAIGFVPTMGFLHKGHLALVDKARSLSQVVVVSIFVNPKQFGPSEDYLTYPRDLDKDREVLNGRGVDILFCPDVDDMYPSGYSTYLEIRELANTLCGRRRPGHLNGVAAVCMKLFNIVRPHLAVFGEKDYQQAIVIKRMVSDMNLTLKIVLSPTIREDDGLAVSSRNIYLGKKEREDAGVLYQALQIGKGLIERGEDVSERVINAMQKMVEEKETAQIEYIEIVDTERLQPVVRINGAILLALAVYFGKARLIDNIVVRGKKYE